MHPKQIYYHLRFILSQYLLRQHDLFLGQTFILQLVAHSLSLLAPYSVFHSNAINCNRSHTVPMVRSVLACPLSFLPKCFYFFELCFRKSISCSFHPESY